MSSDDPLKSHIDRTVGLAAIRKMSRLAADLRTEEQRARRLSLWLLTAAGGLVLLLLLLARNWPDALPRLLRALSGSGT